MTRRFYPDGEVVVIESVNKDPAAAAKLKADGFNSTGLGKKVKSSGEDFNLMLWTKGVPERNNSSYGTASALINIRQGADIDFERAIYTGKFRSNGPIKFDLEGLPKEPGKRRRAMELFAEYKALVIERSMAVIDMINMKRRLLNDEDIGILRGQAAGQSHHFSKKIIVDWFNEKHRVNVIVSATPQGEPEGLPGRPEVDGEKVWNPDEGKSSDW